MAEPDNWDEHWGHYAAAASRNPAQQMRHDLVERLLLRDEPRPCRLLDIGSGQGDMLARLQHRLSETELAGFELSANGVELSRRKVPAGKFVVVDLFQPPVEAEVFAGWADAAVCAEVLEHVDSPVDFLKAARAYLANDARLVVTVPGGPMSAFDRHIGHRQHFTRDSITRVLHEAGFTVDRVYLSGFPFFNLYRGVVIMRGEKLAGDVQAGPRGISSMFAAAVMGVFRGLFKLNLRHFPLGWQVVAVARKR